MIPIGRHDFDINNNQQLDWIISLFQQKSTPKQTDRHTHMPNNQIEIHKLNIRS